MKTIPEILRAQADFIEANAEWIGNNAFTVHTGGEIQFYIAGKKFSESVARRFPDWKWTRQSDRWSKEQINWIGTREDGLKLELSGAESRHIPKLDDMAPEPLILDKVA